MSIRGLPLFEVSEGGALMPSAARARNLLALPPRLPRILVESLNKAHSQPSSTIAPFLGAYSQVIGRTANGHPVFEKRVAVAPLIVGQEVIHAPYLVIFNLDLSN